MADQPRHPDIGEDTGTGAQSRLKAGGSRRNAVLGVIIVIALLVLMIVLHVTGVVGAGTNG